MAIIDDAKADERVAVDLVEFPSDAKIIPFRDGAARAQAEVRPELQFRRGDGYPRLHIRAHPVRIDAGIHEHFGAMVIHLMRLIIVVAVAVGNIVASLRIAPIAHESGKSAKGLSIHVPAAERFPADCETPPRARIAD